MTPAFTKDDALELWRKAEHAAAFAPYGTPCDEAADQAAATVLHDRINEINAIHEARLAEVRAALKPYVVHKSSCRMYVNAYDDCTCGLSAALQKGQTDG